jgi:serine/threonine-protein kinase
LVRPIRALLAGQRQLAGLTAKPSSGSEIEELAGAMAALERHARDREALDQVFLGRYQVLEILGSGGMGTVFRGWDPRLQRPVALKTIHLEPGSGTTVGAAGLLAEAVAGAQIAHPNVVAIYDAQEVGELAFVAMEYVHGIGLDRYLENRGKLSWREAAPLAVGLARGLAAAHERKLAHRDVKPGNVLLGHDGAIKLADFGLAQFVGSRLQRAGRVFGTPGFLAPEALMGLPYDERCDLFALGVILFRAVTGRYPFPGASFREIVVATVRSPTPEPSELGAEIDPEFAQIVCALLVKEPGDRLGPASSLADRLDRLVSLHRLFWRLDFAHGGRALSAAEIFRSANLPTVALADSDLV